MHTVIASSWAVHYFVLAVNWALCLTENYVWMGEMYVYGCVNHNIHFVSAVAGTTLPTWDLQQTFLTRNGVKLATVSPNFYEASKTRWHQRSPFLKYCCTTIFHLGNMTWSGVPCEISNASFIQWRVLFFWRRECHFYKHRPHISITWCITYSSPRRCV